MKRNHKIKALALSMFAGIVIVATPQVRAVVAEEFQNTVSKDDAQIVLSLNSDKTEVQPGDKFTLSFDLDKLPSNNLGVGGISFKIAYDQTKVVADYTEVNPVPDVVLKTPNHKVGPVGSALGMDTLGYGENGGMETLAIAMSKSGDSACKKAGNIFTIGFTVLDNATPGTVDFKLLASTPDPTDITKNIAGMTASGVKFNKTSMKYETDSTTPFYIETNTKDVRVKVEAQTVKFSDTTPVSLDTVEKRTVALGNRLLITPEGAQDNKVTWASSNTSVATVDSQGTVTAKGNGTATITATVDGKTASITVNVVVAPERVEFYDLPDLNLDVTTEKTLSLKNSVKVTPGDAKVESLEWTSSNPSVATVDQNGTVTAVGNGSTEITVKYNDTLKDTVTVNVTTTVGQVALEKSTVVLDMESKLTDTLTYTLNPTTAVVRNVSVKSSDESVATATVNKDTNQVVVTAKKFGTAKITLDVDGKTAVANVTVTVPLKSIVLDKTEITFYKGDPATIKATASPEGSKWEVLSTSVKSGNAVNATADSNTGVVTLNGLERGNAVVAVYANNTQTGDLIKEVNVTVKENRVTKLTLTGESDEMLRGKAMKLTSAYETEEPESVHKTTDQTKITWTSSDEKVAKVDQEGNVTAIAEGEVTITAKMEGSANKVVAEYDLTVIEKHLEEIVVNDEDKKTLENTLNLTTEGSVVIPFEVKPEDCTDTADEIIAKVTEGLDYNKDLVNVEVSYDAEARKGSITVNCVAVGDTEVTIPLGFAEDDEEVEKIVLKLAITEPVEENAETGDIPVGAIAVLMVTSLGGIVVSKKVLVK